MNKSEYLVLKLMEECAEVTQRCSKILCFGIQEKENGQKSTNEERLISEINDFMGVLTLLENKKILRAPTTTELMIAIKNKIAKVEKFMEYSKECGTLHD